jgi:hypothetical protein
MKYGPASRTGPPPLTNQKAWVWMPEFGPAVSVEQREAEDFAELPGVDDLTGRLAGRVEKGVSGRSKR